MFFFDPIYLLFILPGLALSMWASYRTKSAFTKYSKIRASSGMTGAQAARRMLDIAGLPEVKILRANGFLSDHYNPMNRTLNLSAEVYDLPSLASIGVACHEAGHAIQHAQHYKPLWLRSVLVPTANIGSSMGYLVMMAGLFLSGPEGPGFIFMAGVVLFSAVILFQLVTLPVEFDATARAKERVVADGIITSSERVGVDRVLNAAALTYIAAAISSLLTLLYFLMRAGLLGGRRD
ncbi:MAG: zinc metallopeptidase [Acidobacteria bacterium]|nr:zinc metallopeptidase [Acidobacteriota bacterium]MDA1235801.1 zinc metallopeptidase [Acidobacteriota bacterium]